MESTTEVPAPQRCAQAISESILDGTLAPGEVLRQAQLANQLGVSHIPLREGLRILETQGFVRHLPNVGYTVTELNLEDLRQIHLMRRALEAEILRELPVLDDDTLTSLRETNSLMEDALKSGDTLSATRLNKDFHFLMFHRSRLHTVTREVAKLWAISDPYRRMYVWQAQWMASIIREHEKMIELSSRPDRTRLIRLMDRHRNRSYETVSRALGGHTEAAG